ncbi:hypothetical protein Syun_025487 [Stephania yunnanensis]|uniref:Formamidopyrimidine-DNA glycosylase catalytic domain-containing protein n=1 Tax=Stephania yunnanensis TaxID=152371 RepID=A0AAP0HUX0_9MAGN
MPELPEVEAMRRAVSDHCSRKKIVSSIVTNDSKVIDGVSVVDFQASLNRKTIVAAHCNGKTCGSSSISLHSFRFSSVYDRLYGGCARMVGAVYIKGVAITNNKR